MLSEATRILVADDHRAFGLTVAAILRAGLTPNVQVVQTVAAAQAQLKERAPDFLITDLRFGQDFGGLELIEHVRDHPRIEVQLLPILVLSANADLATVKRARALGVNDFLGKPISPALLLQRVQAMAEQAHVVQLPVRAPALGI